MSENKEQNKKLLLKELEAKLHTNDDYTEQYPKDSIMGCNGNICECDDGFLCEHRRKWIIDFFNTNI
jgi:hypothetical protein